MTLNRRGRKSRPITISDVVEVLPRARRSKYFRGADRINFRKPDLLEGSVSGAALQWLKDHRNYDGDDCLIYPWAPLRSNRPALIEFNFKSMPVSRAMCILAHGLPPDMSMLSLHSCGNGHISCCNQKHLRWGTHQENMADMALHGSQKGERSSRAKLTDAQVLEIWRDAKRGRPSDSIAAQYGVAPTTIDAIAAGKSWAWLTLGGGREEFSKAPEPEKKSRRAALLGIADLQKTYRE